MKKMLLFIAAVAILAACSKETPNESPLDKYNGYDQFLKEGEIEKELLSKGGGVGWVTYGFILDPLQDDDFYPDSYFYVKYETTEDWELITSAAGKMIDQLT